jgi:K+-sensing histidine kinase KdpD
MLQRNDIAGRLPIPMTKLPRALFQPIRGKATGYAVAVGLALLATLVRLASDHMLPPGFPFLTFFPAVILTTFLAGRGPGWLCAAISLLSSWYFFIPPFHSFALDRQVLTALIFFSLVVVVDVLLIDGLLQRQQQLVENQQQLAAMAEQQTLLFKELQHRVANNLASIASMLRLQRRQI